MIPDGLSVCHSCDTPPCVNPDHLWLGKPQDNILDAHNKGRINNTGSHNSSVKLTENNVLDIVSLYNTGNYTHHALAQMFDVGHTIIGSILTGSKWNHITHILPEKETHLPISYQPTTQITLLDKFNASYKKIGECWIWNDKLLSTDYGVFYISGTSYLAHRMSYALFIDAIPKELFVCHKCDNPSCVNPDHLWLGTQADNMADAAKKGRMPRGEKSTNSKLTEKQITELLNLYATGNYSQEQIAKMFSISRTVVSNLLHNKTWKHLDLDRTFRKGRGSSGDKNGMRLHPESVRRGEDHPSTKISDATVAEIRNLSSQHTQRELAKMFNVSQTQVGRILRGEMRT